MLNQEYLFWSNIILHKIVKLDTLEKCPMPSNWPKVFKESIHKDIFLTFSSRTTHTKEFTIYHIMFDGVNIVKQT